MSNVTVTVNILGKDYQVSCAPEERDDLIQSARLLDERMRTIRAGGNVIGLERIAVMAALNLSHELLVKDRQPADPEADNRLAKLNEKLADALDNFANSH